MNQLRLALAVVAALVTAPAAFAQHTSADTSASALHWAAHNNDVGAVKRLLSEGADPNLANRFGLTPLHEAATARNAEMLELMLDAGGDANATFGEGETVLMTAARAGDLASVRALLAHGGLPDATENWHGQTALMWAAIENHADVVAALIEAGAEVDRASTKHDWVKISYSEGNVPKTRDLGGLTALQFAARQGSAQAVETLLDAGADASKSEPQYQLTPLQLAIVNGHYTLAKRLVERGVGVDDGSLYVVVDTRNLGFYAQRPNPPEKDGDVTSLDLVNALLEHGANPDLPYTKGEIDGDAKPRLPERTVAGEILVPPGATPLDRAAAAGDFAVVETLLAHGASATVVTEDGTTPLMLLAGYSRARGNAPLTDVPKRLALIRTLLEKGADVHAVHKDSTNNALYFAKQRNAAEIVALLEQFGAHEATAAN
ncbi:MAG TPA: ankyrin repeat domain-containing protein [Gammaproteobacteria bacterium]|nr:ankyrin repeat domain-containing protein [Gammaproteobacteria bacterium]